MYKNTSQKNEKEKSESFIEEKTTSSSFFSTQEILDNFFMTDIGPNIRSFIDKKKNSWKLSQDFCDALQKKSDKEYCYIQLKKQKKEIFERKRILDTQKQWKLTPEYCFYRSSFENFQYCINQYRQQQKNCSLQKTSGTRIIIDLEYQVLYGLKECRLEVYTRVMTGKDLTPTFPGEYKIYHKRGPHYMQGQWFVNKAFYYSGDFAIHDAPWRKHPYWEIEKRKVHGSHGCTNLPKESMEKVWNLFRIGDTVQVFSHLPDDIAQELRQKIRNTPPTLPNS
jgi:hypothetical protein